jgi:hypothetical protein
MSEPLDPRHLSAGWEIPTETYSDQPYIVIADDGAWVCVLTTGVGREGAAGQHVVTLRSTDHGRTWAAPVDVEPADGPEASYAVLLKGPGGRLYCFYNHNTDNLRALRADDPPYAGGLCTRVDSQGHFVFKVSDDHGRSWSAGRYEIPMRNMEIDRANAYGGTVRFFWNVGKPFIHAGAAYVSLHKVGGFGEGFFTRSEGVLLRSADLLAARDPSHATWETMPEGDYGLRTPPGGGPIAEEQSYVVLSDGSFYCVYRTIDGHPACTLSRDGGRTWDTPRYQCYADGRPMKHPRAANFLWKCANGHYLYWFHNHGGRFILEHPRRRTIAYDERNPVWLCGGVEVDTPQGKDIRWSQPEIVLYDDDPIIRMSYPDLVEEEGHYYLTETQKDLARTHAVDPALLEGLWGQATRAEVVTRGLLLSLPAGGTAMPAEAPAPRLPLFTQRDHARADFGTLDRRAGFTVEAWLCLSDEAPGQALLDARLPTGQGWALLTAPGGAVEIILNDGRTENRWACDPGILRPGQRHHVVVIVDGGPKVIAFVVDGALHDGGAARQFGWGRYSPHLREANGSATLRLATARGQVRSLRIYERALRISEAIASFRAGARG